MRKAERLFQLLTLLRSRRCVMTAAHIAAELEVSERTVYRDMQALLLSGIPIDAEAGVGYRLRPGFSLPPLMFDQDELEAIQFGVRMVQGWSGSHLASAASKAMQKIQAVLPEQAHWQHTTANETLVVPDTHREQATPYSNEIHLGIKQKNKLELSYCTENQDKSKRIVWPLGLVFWGSAWTLVAWCELRHDHRMFRLDRIQNMLTLNECFSPSPEQTLQHYLGKMAP